MKFSISFLTHRLLIAVAALTVLFGISVTTAAAAEITFSPATGNFSPGQTFTVTARVAPGGASVNAAEASLRFDPAVLSVVSVSKTGSVFSLWTTEPTFSNTAGTISFGGGNPTPFTATSNLVTITFRALAAGTGALSVTSASVVAADGRGTDVYSRGGTGSFTIAQQTTPTPTPTPPPAADQPSAPAAADDDGNNNAIVFGDAPRAPEVGSQVFLDPEVWYNVTEGKFEWEVPFDVNELAVMIATSADNQPELTRSAIQKPPTNEFIITRDVITDGVQYLGIKYRNQVGWGTVLNRKLMIDTTPPEPFTIDVRISNSQTGFPQLNFAATDTTSGIDFYEMTIADNEPIQVTPDEANVGYLLRDLEDGTYTVKVVAVDRAGNKRESSVAVQINAGWVKPAETVIETTIWDYFTARNIFLAILLLIIALQFLFIWYDRKQNKLREDKLRREVREIQDQMEKIFSALRDEIYDQVNLISKRPRLSIREKEAVEGLNQALEVSETLIEKEINDVKTILR